MRTGSRVQVTDRLALDSNLSYGGVTTQSGVALPIAFVGAGQTTILDQTITGGALGLNGYLEVKLGGAFSITADAAIGLTASVDGTALTPLYNSGTLATSSGPYYLDGLIWMQNQNSEVTGIVATQMVWFDRNSTTIASAYRSETSKAGTDTSNDWTLTLKITATSLASGTGEISIARVNSYFIP